MVTGPSSRLRELWLNRPTLNELEWSELYRLVLDALRDCAGAELRALGSERSEAVQEFFLRKVLLPASFQAGAPFSNGALCVWFKRFLCDRLRSAHYRLAVDLPDEDKLGPTERAEGSRGNGRRKV